MKKCLIRNCHRPIQIRKSIHLARPRCLYANLRSPAPTSLTRLRNWFRLENFQLMAPPRKGIHAVFACGGGAFCSGRPHRSRAV